MTRTIPWIAALLTLALHLAGNPHYGFFRDELYFIICGFRPQFGYVDQPPVVPLLAAFTQLGGHSLFLLRAVPALCAAGGVYVTTLLALEFGGGAFAQLLAALGFAGAFVLLSFGTTASPDEMGLWLWPLIALWLVRLARGADPRWWLALGVAAGIAVESKYTALFFFAALLAGLLLTPERRILRSRWALAAAGLALLIVLPNFAWQAGNGFPMWELLRAGQNGKNLSVPAPIYLLQEVVITNPYLAPLWIAGVVWLVRAPYVRFLGYAYLVLIAEMILLHGKHYYPGDVYPIVIAAGAVQVETWTARLRFASAARAALAAYAVFFGAIGLPMQVPILSVSQLVAYKHAMKRFDPFSAVTMATEQKTAPEIGSDYADMHGWPEFAAAAKSAYEGLAPAERARAVVFATDYGQASALRFFAPDVPVISGHNQYWLWGYAPHSGDVILELGGTCWKSEKAFAQSSVALRYQTGLPVMDYENGLSFLICRQRLVPMATLWEKSKNYN